MALSQQRVLQIAVVTVTVITLLLVFGTGHTQLEKRPGRHYSVTPEGEGNTLDYKLYFHRQGDSTRISPWHDISLMPEGGAVQGDTFTFVCEIPRGARAKMEINKESEWNPIIQDTKKGALRFYHSPSLVNYGAFPQTWEDPGHEDALVPGTAGDNDPTDVIDFSGRTPTAGEVYSVKVLGALGMLDDGELDWKIVVVDAASPLAAEVDDVTDLPQGHPLAARLVQVREWFRDYKLPDGKPQNKFSNGGEYYGKAAALKVVALQHKLWKGLVATPHTPAAEMWWQQGGE